jgi:hypothetical protein
MSEDEEANLGPAGELISQKEAIAEAQKRKQAELKTKRKTLKKKKQQQQIAQEAPDPSTRFDRPDHDDIG